MDLSTAWVVRRAVSEFIERHGNKKGLGITKKGRRTGRNPHDGQMEWLSLFADWVFASLWERLLLCAETVAIMIGGPLAWWNRLTLKSHIGALRRDLADMRRKQDEILSMMGKMVGQPEEKQKKILEVATMRASAMEATATVNKRAPRADESDDG